MAKSFGWKHMLIDVCTQRDFLDAGAVLQVVNRDIVVPHLEAVFSWAVNTGIGVASVVESHRPSEPYHDFPMHCIDGTLGQKKLPYTLLDPRLMVENDNYLSLPPDLEKKYRQLIFRKRNRDILSNPKTDRFLTSHEASDMIIVGVGLERAIRTLALGLRARHKRVTVVTDACGCWSRADGELAALQLGAKGIRLVTTAELTAPPPPRQQAARRRRSQTRYHSAAAAQESRPSRD